RRASRAAADRRPEHRPDAQRKDHRAVSDPATPASSTPKQRRTTPASGDRPERRSGKGRGAAANGRVRARDDGAGRAAEDGHAKVVADNDRDVAVAEPAIAMPGGPAAV